MTRKLAITASAVLFAMPQVAFAHVGDHGLSGSFTAGLVHPLVGLDHLIMLFALGAIASSSPQTKVRVSFIIGVLLTMLAGMGLGLISGSAVGIETIIMASVFVAAAAIWKASSDTLLSSLLSGACSLMVVAHGWAHGVELAGTSVFMFSLGMLLGSLFAMMLGVVVAKRVPAKVIASSVAASGMLLAALG